MKKMIGLGHEDELYYLDPNGSLLFTLSTKCYCVFTLVIFSFKTPFLGQSQVCHSYIESCV